MCYGGIGNTSMENPENRDLDNDSQDNFQDDNTITINLQDRMIKTSHRRWR